MISWFSRKQSSVALNTTEKEYIATYLSSCEAIWLQKLISGLINLELDTTMILCDNQSCINMTENPLFHDRSKHIEIRYFYNQDMMQKGAIKLQYVSTDEQVPDVLTKPLSRESSNTFETRLVWFGKTFLERGSSDVAVGLYHPWELALK